MMSGLAPLRKRGHAFRTSAPIAANHNRIFFALALCSDSMLSVVMPSSSFVDPSVGPGGLLQSSRQTRSPLDNSVGVVFCLRGPLWWCTYQEIWSDWRHTRTVLVVTGAQRMPWRMPSGQSGRRWRRFVRCGSEVRPPSSTLLQPGGDPRGFRRPASRIHLAPCTALMLPSFDPLRFPPLGARSFATLCPRLKRETD